MAAAFAATLTFLASAAAAQSKEPTSYNHALAAGIKALILCEGIFSAGRTEAQIAAVELRNVYPDYDALDPSLIAKVDRSFRRVAIAYDAQMPPRRADWFPRTGCTLQPIGGESTRPPALHPHPSIPGPADPAAWPQGDAGIAPRPSRPLAERIVAAFDGQSYGAGVSIGVVIVHRGEIVAERYTDGFGPLVPNRTWSVAKSIAGTLVGVAVAQGRLDPAAPAPVPEWTTPRDPRQAITLDHLLRMASGLHSHSAGNRTDDIYFGGTSVTEQATGWPIEAPSGSRFRYANNDTLLAVRALRASLGDDNAYWNMPGDSLFFPLGMQHTTTGTDWQGNFVLSSQVWSTARDLARLGLFWLNDGVWRGKRILPDGWMKYMTTPSGPQPPGDGPGYGATLWLFGPKEGLPDGSYAAQGNRGQFIMVVPAKRLVVVRRGEDPAGTRFDIARFTADVIEALE